MISHGAAAATALCDPRLCMCRVLQCNMETAAAKDATLLSELTSAMLDTSVASSSERCVVYTPLHVLVGVKKATSPFAPGLSHVTAAACAISHRACECWLRPNSQAGGSDPPAKG